jgi:CO/xanthine dehydrogenase Mo-binding subunit
MIVDAVLAFRPFGVRSLGDDERRVEGKEKVSGAAQYSADFSRPNMLWAAFLPSDRASARIVNIDVEGARAVPGVVAVLTGADIGERYFGRRLLDWPVLAYERVRFIGEYVVAVAAESRPAAQAAVREIVVTYEDLPAVFDMQAALDDDAPKLHEDPERYHYIGDTRPEVPHPNVQGRTLGEKGDIAFGFGQAARIFEHRFSTPRHHGGHIEPRATLVWIDDADVVHVYSTNKSLFALRTQMSLATGVPIERIVIEQPFIGGDFGAKGHSVEEYICYYLARATSRPVKAVRSYTDDVMSTNVRHAAEITLRTGVDAAGRFTAFDARVLFDGGAYAAAKPLPALIPGSFSKLPYYIPNARAECIAVYTNTVPAGHLRAPADVQISFAVESHVDTIARALGMDPIAFRLLNAIRGDQLGVDAIAYRKPRAAACLEALRTAIRWDEPLPPGHGRGVALCVRHIGHGRGGVRIRLHRSGRLSVGTAMTDQGVGALTLLQRVIAAELTIEPEMIDMVRDPSDIAIYDDGPGAARGAHVAGQAALDGARNIRTFLEEHGDWDGRPETWLASVRTALGDAEGTDLRGVFDAAGHAGEAEYHNFSAYAMEVAVDRDTGAVTVRDVVYVADTGAIINPVAHQGQIDGGFVFGYGHAQTEELQVEDGRIINLSLADYKLPSQPDVPPLRTVLLPPDGGPGPFGARMAGEMSTAGVAPALANAVADACGARINRMPITAERVYEALHSDMPRE